MSDSENFNQQLFMAVEAKKEWYDSQETPTLVAEYRNLHGVVDNLVSMLVDKGLIQRDPYKVDKKISDIVVPSEEAFLDTERSMVMGVRLSEYESMLDFICNIFNFSVGNVTLERIKTLLALNSFIQWNAVSPNSPKPNTKALAEILQPLKMSSESLTANVINDNLNYAARTIAKINSLLKNLTEFQKELFKIEIRKTVLEHPGFSYEKALASTEAASSMIRKLYPQVMGKRPYYSELVDELVAEEFGPDKEKLRSELLKKFEVQEKTKVEQKKAAVDTKEMLLDAVRALGSSSTLLEQIILKIEENSRILQTEKQTFWDKVKIVIRQAFNQPEPPIQYEVILIDPLTQAKKHETLNYQDFVNDLNKRKRTYVSFSIKKAPGYIKMQGQNEDAILEYLNKQLSECNYAILVLLALDEYFKNSVQVANCQKIKGLKMELTALKNTLVKTNQRKTEYTSLIEEEAQLKRLGISND